MFKKYSISEIQKNILDKKISPLEMVNESILAYKESNPKFKAWVSFDEKKLVDAANLYKSKLEKKIPIRMLEGIPCGVKDIFNTIDFPTQMGSSLWDGFTPGNDARVVYSLKNSGAVVAGKTVTAEFAVHYLNETLNPHNTKLTPGTSSSGSAVAVSTGIVPFSIGSQTAGSIIRPASFCGVYAFKPSFGLIPRTGMLKTTDSLDTVGFFTHKAEDIRLIFDVLCVKGLNYPISHAALNDLSRQVKSESRPWNVGFAKTHTWGVTKDYVKNSIIAFLDGLNIDPNININECELPEISKESHLIHKLIYDKSLAYYFSVEYENKDQISPIMGRLIESGDRIKIDDFKSALTLQEKLIQEMDNLYKSDLDIIISISTSSAAPPRNENETDDPSLMWTLSHLPSINIPLFMNEHKEPFGLQISARKYNDKLLLRFLDYLLKISAIPKSSNLLPD